MHSCTSELLLDYVIYHHCTIVALLVKGHPYVTGFAKMDIPCIKFILTVLAIHNYECEKAKFAQPKSIDIEDV